jgi:hypothetical protein
MTRPSRRVRTHSSRALPDPGASVRAQQRACNEPHARMNTIALRSMLQPRALIQHILHTGICCMRSNESRVHRRLRAAHPTRQAGLGATVRTVGPETDAATSGPADDLLNVATHVPEQPERCGNPQLQFYRRGIGAISSFTTSRCPWLSSEMERRTSALCSSVTTPLSWG